MKVSDKLTKINDCINVNVYDNGFMVEVSGRTKDDDYSQVKILCSDLAAVGAVLKEAVEMERS
jgi:hypothetical protein